MKAGEELWLHSRVQMVHMASGDAQPCTAAVRGSNNEPRSRGNSQSLHLGPCAKHCPPGVPAHWPHAQSCLRTKPWVSLAAVTTAPLWVQEPPLTKGSKRTTGRDHYIFILFLHPPCVFVLTTLLDEGFGARQTFDLSADIDWWMLLALTIHKKDKSSCCDLLWVATQTNSRPLQVLELKGL